MGVSPVLPCTVILAQPPHITVLSICVRPRYQRRGRHGLLSESNDEGEAGQKNKQFLKSTVLYANRMRTTLPSFKMPYRLVALDILGLFFAPRLDIV